MISHLTHVQLFATLWTDSCLENPMDPLKLLSPWDSLGKNTGVGCLLHIYMYI